MLLLAAGGCAEGASGSDPAADAMWSPPPGDAGFDYQIGGDYQPADGVEVVARDWFEGSALRHPGYSVCYVNAFQTQPDDDAVDRPDERSAWPSDLVLGRLGDDPAWGGEYLVDLSTPTARAAAVEHVRPMIERCDEKGFDAVELDNLDSWTRFDGTPLSGEVPFGRDDALAYAQELIEMAHEAGLAAGQKNTAELGSAGAEAGFDFAVVEECGDTGECQGFVDVYGDRILAVEYTDAGFEAACASVGAKIAVVRRDRAVVNSGAGGYIFDAC